MLDSQQVFCSVRKTWVAATPEEMVRQQWIQHLTQPLGYPIESLGVEKELRQMPHLALSPMKLPTRRADLIVFGRDLLPLLLIEFKAVPLTEKAWRQVLGYNFYLGAPFVALANGQEARFGIRHGESFTRSIPHFKELKQHLTTEPTERH